MAAIHMNAWLEYRCFCGKEYWLAPEMAGQSVRCYFCERIGIVELRLSAPPQPPMFTPPPPAPAPLPPRETASPIPLVPTFLTAPAPASTPVPLPEKHEFLAFGVVLEKSFVHYIHHFRNWLLISAIAMLGFFLSLSPILGGKWTSALFVGYSELATVVGIFLTAAFLTGMLSWWLGAILLVVTHQAKDPAHAWLDFRNRVWSFAKLLLMILFLIVGTSFLFLIPGLILLARLSAAPFLFLQGERGNNAIIKSFQLTKGHTWTLFWRVGLLLFTWLVCWGIPQVGMLCGLLFVPVMLEAAHQNFRELQRLSSGASFVESAWLKNGLWLTALLGYFLLPLLSIVLTGGLFWGSWKKWQKLEYEKIKAQPDISVTAQGTTFQNFAV